MPLNINLSKETIIEIFNNKYSFKDKFSIKDICDQYKEMKKEMVE